MKNLDFKKKNNNSIYLLILISLTFLTEPEMYTVFFIFISMILILNNKNIFFNSLRYFKYLLLLFFFGSFFILNNDFSYIKKDIGYLIKAITCFLIGFLLGVKISNFTKFLEYIIILLSIYSLYWIYLVFTGLVNFDNYAEFNLLTFKSIPYIATLILPLILLKIDDKYYLDFKIFNRYLYFFIILIGIFFSFSRSRIFLALLSFLIIFVFYNKKKNISYIIFFISTILFITLNNFFLENFSPFIGKFKNTYNEILFFNENDLKEIYSNWRGFEALKAYEQFQNVGLLKKFFGQSFGSTVDLQNNYMIGNLSYRQITFLHNGYFMILTKFGIIGIILVIIFYFRITFPLNGNLIISSKNNDKILYTLKGILMIYFIFLTLVVAGIFNHSSIDHLILFSGSINGYLNTKI